jgi:hypothetical protein
MNTITALVWFPGEADAYRETEIQVIPSTKVLRGGSGFPIDHGPPRYHLPGYNLETANIPANRAVQFIAQKAPAF